MNPSKRCTYSVVWFGCYMAGAYVKLLPSRRICCAGPQYSHVLVYSVIFETALIRRVHACLAVTCHLHFWQND